MRTSLALCAVVLASVAVLAGSQEPKKGGKGKTEITVTGCVEGGWLRVREVDTAGSYTERYKLRGSKQLLKEMASKHNNKVLEITGRVTDAPGTTHMGNTVQVGKKTKIYTGAKDVPQVPSGEASTLDVSSYRETEQSCKG